MIDTDDIITTVGRLYENRQRELNNLSTTASVFRYSYYRRTGAFLIKVGDLMYFKNSSDIYLEKDGEKIATVQCYEARHIAGEYAIKLTRVYGIDVLRDVRELDSFDLVVEKANSTIRYTDCRIKGTVEEGVIGGMILDVVYVVAKGRTEK